MRKQTAIVGVGATPFTKRGGSAPQTLDELVCKAIIAAADDAGIAVPEIDGFAYFAGGFDTPFLVETLGIPEVRYTASLTGSGGGSAGIVGLAASAIVSGLAEVVVCVGAVQQTQVRYGAMTTAYAATPQSAFYKSAALVGPGHMFALLARRHMHLYGTRREHFAEVALTARANAANHPRALMRKPLTLDQYMAAPPIADPHCLYDFCLESDGAVAVIVTSAERAKDLRQRPVQVLASTHGGAGEWGRSIYTMNMSDDTFASSGHAAVARRLYEMAGVGPNDIDVAQIYDHFTSQVIMQLEDYGFCDKGEGGPFVASGAIRLDGGKIPVNTDGGQLSGAYIWGMTHVQEAVEQLRGTAVNQVSGAEVALVTGGPASLPVSGLILGV
ncbi:Thiolase [Sphingobium herbicidovorans NBRC 16415]|uniref:Thiolase n=1 Tax=Sphingobium herbicidovorans (strain ATCC 700291 / DSM 11019 / CCUG 56400 / KCTC 2939 / LMG 18315 / NBRC 16415 / MH) TaxID=1219045 RepID=A0A086PC25_SPHHM|nr:thiolase [Sphingobium herbicidovorans]KFG90943.1 Thiolase [Sphingobium herbicidovorans NBRC 16415]